MRRSGERLTFVGVGLIAVGGVIAASSDPDVGDILRGDTGGALDLVGARWAAAARSRGWNTHGPDFRTQLVASYRRQITFDSDPRDPSICFRALNFGLTEFSA